MSHAVAASTREPEPLKRRFGRVQYRWRYWHARRICRLFQGGRSFESLSKQYGRRVVEWSIRIHL